MEGKFLFRLFPLCSAHTYRRGELFSQLCIFTADCVWAGNGFAELAQSSVSFSMHISLRGSHARLAHSDCMVHYGDYLSETLQSSFGRKLLEIWERINAFRFNMRCLDDFFLLWLIVVFYGLVLPLYQMFAFVAESLGIYFVVEPCTNACFHWDPLIK